MNFNVTTTCSWAPFPVHWQDLDRILLDIDPYAYDYAPISGWPSHEGGMYRWLTYRTQPEIEAGYKGQFMLRNTPIRDYLGVADVSFW